jgi:hypothetical protein
VIGAGRIVGKVEVQHHLKFARAQVCAFDRIIQIAPAAVGGGVIAAIAKGKK